MHARTSMGAGKRFHWISAKLTKYSISHNFHMECLQGWYLSLHAVKAKLNRNSALIV